MSTQTESPTFTYSIDPNHSTVRFWVRHMMIAKVHGELSDVKGTVTGSPEAPRAAKVDVTIGVDSFTTRNDARDGHVKSADFLDAENFPTMHFVSKEIKSSGDGEWEVVGDFTLRGVTREIVLRAEVTPEVASPFGGVKVGVTATGVLNREDFGITYNQALETGGVLIGKEIHIQIDLELDRA